jgi:hypothetical protein
VEPRRAELGGPDRDRTGDLVNAIVLDENARITHLLVRDAAAELRSGRPDRDGIVRTPPGCIDVRVSKGSVSRALRILQALFRALEPRGYTVAIKDGKTFVNVLGESYRVFLKERLRRTVRDLTPEEHKRRREGIDVYPYQLVPTGELALHLDSWPSRAVADRKKARLEDLLNEFLELLVERAYADKAGQPPRSDSASSRRVERICWGSSSNVQRTGRPLGPWWSTHNWGCNVSQALPLSRGVNGIMVKRLSDDNERCSSDTRSVFEERGTPPQWQAREVPAAINPLSSLVIADGVAFR